MKKNHEPSFISENRNVLGGILVLGLIGAGSAIFLNSSVGKKLKNDLADLCQCVGEEVKDFTCDVAQKTEDVSREMAGHFFKKNQSNCSNVLIGAVAGSILGISAVLLLTHDGAKGFRNNVCHTFCTLTDKACALTDSMQEKTGETVDDLEERLTYWVKTIRTLMDTLHVNSRKKRPNITLDKCMDWATLGIRLFQSLKK